MVGRTSSGTGVIVSLVVFVLGVVFLLVLAIVFYAGQTKAEQAELAANTTLSKYVTREQRNREQNRQPGKSFHVRSLLNTTAPDSLVRRVT